MAFDQSPEWEANVTLRSPDDSKIAAALVKCAWRRNPKSDIEEFNKLLLNVSFDQKDTAKTIGAK